MSTLWSHGITIRTRSLALIPLAFVLTSTLPAQEHSWRGLGVLAGPAEYDLSGTGWSWAAAARFDMPVGRVLIVEPGLGFFTYQAQPATPLLPRVGTQRPSYLAVPQRDVSESGDRNSWLLPEVSLQLQYPGRRIRPYIGVGGGGAVSLQGSAASDLTVHGALGLRAAVGRSWTVRGEGRARNISGFQANNSILELLIGINRQL